MPRVTYELGARGTDIDTENFVRKLREYGDYFGGTWSEIDVKSVHKTVYLDSGRTVEGFVSQLTGWCAQWSKEYPELEVFFTATQDRGSELWYGVCERGELKQGETILTHARLNEVLGENCNCQVRSRYYEKYPTEAPFSDCPMRLNPPTKWAIENIMEAHERIGMR